MLPLGCMAVLTHMGLHVCPACSTATEGLSDVVACRMHAAQGEGPEAQAVRTTAPPVQVKGKGVWCHCGVS